jgi:hypothetical protein
VTKVQELHAQIQDLRLQVNSGLPAASVAIFAAEAISNASATAARTMAAVFVEIMV